MANKKNIALDYKIEEEIPIVYSQVNNIAVPFVPKIESDLTVTTY